MERTAVRQPSGFVTRFSDRGYPYQVWEPAVPRIDDVILKCVTYLYRTVDEANRGEAIGGSGFLVGVPSPLKLGHVYLYAVTNRHVVYESGAPVVRVNTKDGKFDPLELEQANWMPHPNGDDVAISPIGLNTEHHDFAFINESRFFTKELIEEHDIGPGDDAFMVGRFVNHEGKERNLPSVRFGNIGMMPLEPMQHPIYGRPQDSFVVEMRSISGYSGSPVFVYIPPMAQRPKSNTIRASSFGPGLIGVDWGHIKANEPVRNRYDKTLPEEWHVHSNSGMIGVVPVWKLSELLHLKQLEDFRMANDEQIREEKSKNPNGMVVDSAEESEPPTTEDNPTHAEDFRSLLDAAAKRKRPADGT